MTKKRTPKTDPKPKTKRKPKTPPPDNPTNHGWTPIGEHPEYQSIVYTQAGCFLVKLPNDWIARPGPDGYELHKLPAGQPPRQESEWIVQLRDGSQAHCADDLATITASLLADETKPEGP